MVKTEKRILAILVSSVLLSIGLILSVNAAVDESGQSGCDANPQVCKSWELCDANKCRPKGCSGTSPAGWCGAGNVCDNGKCQPGTTAAPASPAPASTIDYTGRPTCGGGKHYAGKAFGQCGGLVGYTNKDVIAINCAADGTYHAVLHYKNLKPCGTERDPGGLVHKCANGVDASNKNKNYWTQRGGTAGLESKDPNCVYAVTCNVDGSYSNSVKALQCDEGKQETTPQPATPQPAATTCPTCASFPGAFDSAGFCYAVRCSSTAGCKAQQVRCPDRDSIPSGQPTASCQLGGGGTTTGTQASSVPAAGTSCTLGDTSRCKDRTTVLTCETNEYGYTSDERVWKSVSCGTGYECVEGRCRLIKEIK